MKNRTSLVRAARIAAIAVALAGVGLWLSTGAHTGWTQTSKVSMQRDEITGIDFPVRNEAFVAGVEVPAAAIVAAGVLAASSLLVRRTPQAI